MKKSIFKTIVFGALFGALIFFTGPLILIVLLLKFIFTPFGMGRMYHYKQHGFMHAYARPPFGFADKIRSMSDEEYDALKAKMQNNYGHHCHYTK